jgi:hypothetical protein
VLAWVAALTVTGTTYAGTPGRGVERPVAGTSCPTFPADDYWHADVRHLPVDPRG